MPSKDSEGFCQLGNQFEQVTNQPVVRHLEDRGFFVLVDRDVDLLVFHAGQLLDHAGDTDGDVQLWRYDLFYNDFGFEGFGIGTARCLHGRSA